jgi:hypothetical protein
MLLLRVRVRANPCAEHSQARKTLTSFIRSLNHQAQYLTICVHWELRLQPTNKRTILFDFGSQWYHQSRSPRSSKVLP